MVVSFHVGVGTKPLSSARATCAPNLWAIFSRSFLFLVLCVRACMHAVSAEASGIGFPCNGSYRHCELLNMGAVSWLFVCVFTRTTAMGTMGTMGMYGVPESHLFPVRTWVCPAPLETSTRLISELLVLRFSGRLVGEVCLSTLPLPLIQATEVAGCSCYCWALECVVTTSFSADNLYVSGGFQSGERPRSGSKNVYGQCIWPGCLLCYALISALPEGSGWLVVSLLYLLT